MTYLLFFSIALTASFLGVRYFLQWSLKRKVYDIPNERSSHVIPTPVGGGLIIVLVCLSMLLIYSVFLKIEYFLWYFIGAALVALISWLDDLYSIRIGWRLLFHVLAALCTILGLGFWEKMYLPWWGILDLGNWGMVLTFFWIVWLINAYNFMDGIDGIASVQAISAGLGWLVIGILEGYWHTSFYGGVIAFSSIGFLIYNWPPAKIFMGDVGSAFLGYTFASMPLLARKEQTDEGLLPLLGMALVLLFILDSLLTLLKRLLRGEKIWTAHRQHIYQKLVINGLSHRAVTSLYGLVSAVILIILIYWIKYR